MKRDILILSALCTCCNLFAEEITVKYLRYAGPYEIKLCAECNKIICAGVVEAPSPRKTFLSLTAYLFKKYPDFNLDSKFVPAIISDDIRIIMDYE